MLLNDGKRLREFFRNADRHNVKMQVVALDTPLEQAQRLLQFRFKIVANLFDHIPLGRGGEAGDRRQFKMLFVAQLANETRRIQVIGPEIMAPF